MKAIKTLRKSIAVMIPFLGSKAQETSLRHLLVLFCVAENREISNPEMQPILQLRQSQILRMTDSLRLNGLLDTRTEVRGKASTDIFTLTEKGQQMVLKLRELFSKEFPDETP